MPTALTAYLTGSASTGVLSSTANKLSAITPSPASKVNITVGTGILWGELSSRGGGWAGAASESAPTGNGWILDDTSLEGCRLAAGAWTAVITLADYSSSSTISLSVHARAYKRSSAGVYTLLAEGSQAVTLGLAPRTILISITTVSSTDFATGDKLYIDLMAQVTTASTDGSLLIYLYQNGGVNESFATPGYDVIPYFSGSSAILAKKPVVAGAVLETISGSGGVTARRCSLSAALLESYTGSISVPARKPSVAVVSNTAIVGVASVAGKKPSVHIYASYALRVSTDTLLPFPLGAYYSQTLHAIGGVAPLTWMNADPPLAGERVPGEGSNLPDGLSLTSGGVISGTSTIGGTTVFYARVTDSQGTSASHRYLIEVSTAIVGAAAAAGKKPSIALTGGETYAGSVAVSGKSPTASVEALEVFSGSAAIAGPKPLVSIGVYPLGAISVSSRKPAMQSFGYVPVSTPMSLGLRFVTTARVGVEQ